MRYIFLLLSVAFMQTLYSQSVPQEILEQYTAKTFEHKGNELLYRVLLPKDFDENKTYPLHLFLHGAGERGNDNESQLVPGADLFIKNQEQFPAIVIFPQCPEGDYWADVAVTRSEDENIFDFPKTPNPTWAMSAVLSLLDTYLTNDYVDKNRIYLSGLSMGGMGTLELLYHKPETFAAATPICGGGYPSNVASWANNTPTWIFHGEVDGVVPVRYSQLMAEALIQQGVSPRLSIYPDVNHDSWTTAFAEPNFLSWIYSQHKKEIIPQVDPPTEEDCTPEWLKFSEETLLLRFEESNNQLALTEDPDRIVFIGDSITQGWLGASPNFWAEHPSFVNRGVGGHTTPQMLLRFKRDVLQLQPQTVIILAGTNDVAGNTGETSTTTIVENIETMAELARLYDINVILSSVLPVSDYPWKPGLEPAQTIATINNELKKLSDREGYTYIDYHAVMKDRIGGMQALLSYDGVHCTKAGYEVMESVLLDVLKE